jgi:hypothetical protein
VGTSGTGEKPVRPLLTHNLKYLNCTSLNLVLVFHWHHNCRSLGEGGDRFGIVMCLIFFYRYIFIFFFFLFLLFMCAYNVWVISPVPSLSLRSLPLPPLSSCYQTETILPLSLILLESISNNRKEQGFLLVEIRIAIQGVDLHCFPVHVCYLLN